MKNNGMRLLLAGLFLCAAMPVLAQQKSSEEKKLDKAAVELDKEAGKPEAAKTVTDKIKAEFGVDDARVQGLRDQKMGYGEVSIVLSLAQGMPGGITDANVQKVMALRQGPPVMGWGEIAKELGFKLGPAVSKVKKITAAAHRQRNAGKMGKSGKAGKSGKMEKMEMPEKHEMMDRPEKGGRPETSGRH